MNIHASHQLFEKALQVIPGGVNSPVRAFKAVGGHPLFIKNAKGAFIYDQDNNSYIELINSWGPMILGHTPDFIIEAVQEAIQNSLSFGAPCAAEVDMAELIVNMVPCAEKVRMVNSGTEATMSAIRVARGYTGRHKILKFEGCYHGHGDSFLIAAGSGAITMGTPDSPGVTPGTAADTLLAPFNDLEAVEKAVKNNPGMLAAIIVEPVAGNMGCVAPAPGFLEGLRNLCTREGIVLIFDEVMTGFRLAPGGAQELYGVTPDMATLGKIIGGGMPVGAYCGKKEIMDCVSPVGKVYQAGTLSGNPVAMAAGYAMLTYLQSHPEVYVELDRITTKIADGIKNAGLSLGKNFTVNRVGSMFTLFFTEQPVTDFASAQTSDTEMFGKFFRTMLQNGVYIAPAQYEALFVSASITDGLADQIIHAAGLSMEAALKK